MSHACLTHVLRMSTHRFEVPEHNLLPSSQRRSSQAMPACVRACVHACLHVCACACVHATPPMCRHLYTSVCVCTDMYDKCMCIRSDACIDNSMNMCIGHLCRQLQLKTGLPHRPQPTIHDLRCLSLHSHGYCYIFTAHNYVLTITVTVAS